MRNDEVAHAWANQVKQRGKAENFSFNGNSLYSYNTEIARFINTPLGHEIIIYTTKPYSVTTRGKHQTAMHRAMRHLEAHPVDCDLRYLNNWEDIKQAVTDHYENAIKLHIDRLHRTKSVSGDKAWLKGLVSKLNAFHALYDCQLSIPLENLHFHLDECLTAVYSEDR